MAIVSQVVVLFREPWFTAKQLLKSKDFLLEFSSEFSYHAVKLMRNKMVLVIV